MDSMINHYTANRKVRNDDAYSPGGADRPPARPGHAGLLPACARSLPRRAGDCRRRRGQLAAAGPLRLLERQGPPLDHARLQGRPAGLRHGRARRSSRSPSGWPPARRCATCATCAAWPIGWAPSETPPDRRHDHAAQLRAGVDRQVGLRRDDEDRAQRDQSAQRPAAGAVSRSRVRGGQSAGAAAVAEPRWTASTACRSRASRIRATASSRIPAYEVVKDSVQIMRGCFGGCTFCSITAHEGRIIQSRSQESVLGEIRQMAADPEFKGMVSDIGGPTANMYQMRCTRPEVEAKCRRLSCVHPTICKLLGTDHGPLVQLMQAAREEPGVKKVLVASGIRMDLARRSPEYMRELADASRRRASEGRARAHRPRRAGLMKKPGIDDFEKFDREFKQASQAGRQEAVSGALLHRQPPGQHARLDDRPGAVPQAQPLPARPGAGLHSQPVRHRRLHVPHRARSVHQEAGATSPSTCAIASCSGR